VDWGDHMPLDYLKNKKNGITYRQEMKKLKNKVMILII
jgi:hypothetical protein